MKIMCECCRKYFDSLEHNFDWRTNWRGKTALYCEHCCQEFDELKAQEEQLKKMEQVEDDEI